MSLPRGIRYETLPERLVQGKAFQQHIDVGFLQRFTCVSMHLCPYERRYRQTRRRRVIVCLKRFACVRIL